MSFRIAALALPILLLAPAFPSFSQVDAMGVADGKKLPSPPATTSANFNGQQVLIKYNSPSIRGRKIVGGLVPYNQVWRTGANPATTLITPVSLHIGPLLVPAGTYTLYSLPAESGKWQLIVNKQTGQWGTEYTQSMDLGRVPLREQVLKTPQQVMSISFDETKGDTSELHIRWENSDESIKVSTP